MNGRAPIVFASVALLTLCAAGLVRTVGSMRDRPALPAPAVVDINAASVERLDLLPRIGPALARRIVDDRAEHGPYEDLDDLDRVPGIGPKTVEGLRPFATALD